MGDAEPRSRERAGCLPTEHANERNPLSPQLHSGKISIDTWTWDNATAPLPKKREPSPARHTIPGLRPILLTTFVFFVIVLAVLFWRRESRAPVVPSADVVPLAAPAAPPPSRSLQAGTIISAQEPARVAASRPTTQIRAVDSQDTVDPTGVPVPADFAVFNRRSRHRYEGYVENRSGKPLLVELETRSDSNQVTSQLQLNLAPGERKNFTSEDGLDLHSNDQLVLHSPPYQDVKSPVP